MKLSNFTQGKDNNFNLIRAIAAMAVLVTHSFALSTGTREAEPFQDVLGMTMGDIAVDIFFITSGFLVTASLLNRQSFIEFIWARILRIFPALLVMLLITVFGLGVFFTSLPLQNYLTDSKTYFYFLKCATLISGIVYKLPGVFEGNPRSNTVNGSLWTMPYEVRMYAILAMTWLVLRVAKDSRLRVFQLLIISSALIAGVLAICFHFSDPERNKFIWLFFMFFLGASCYVLRQKIAILPLGFFLALMSLAASVLINKEAFFIVYVLSIAYILFYFAYIPSGFIRKYNQMGDYSYGIYIYAFPVQQSVAALIPGVPIPAMIVISASITLLLAALSWHLLEKRALALKGHYVGQTKRIFNADGR